MSVHVRFETPTEVSDKIYEMIQSNSNGRIKKGSNEVTKTAERGTAQFIVLAEDVNPPELLAHIPLICEEKGIPIRICSFTRIPSKRSWPTKWCQDRFNCNHGNQQECSREVPRSC